MASVGGEGDERDQGGAGRQRTAADRQQALTLVPADDRTTHVAVVRVPRPTVVESTGARLYNNTNTLRSAATANNNLNNNLL